MTEQLKHSQQEITSGKQIIPLSTTSLLAITTYYTVPLNALLWLVGLSRLGCCCERTVSVHLSGLFLLCSVRGLETEITPIRMKTSPLKSSWKSSQFEVSSLQKMSRNIYVKTSMLIINQKTCCLSAPSDSACLVHSCATERLCFIEAAWHRCRAAKSSLFFKMRGERALFLLHF